jgi:hypothetical protein
MATKWATVVPCSIRLQAWGSRPELYVTWSGAKLSHVACVRSTSAKIWGTPTLMARRTNGHVLFTTPQYAGACMREESFSEGSIRMVAAAGQLHINPAVACNLV